MEAYESFCLQVQSTILVRVYKTCEHSRSFSTILLNLKVNRSFLDKLFTDLLNYSSYYGKTNDSKSILYLIFKKSLALQQYFVVALKVYSLLILVKKIIKNC